MIHIDEQQRQLLSMANRHLPFAFEAFIERSAAGKSGERIGCRVFFTFRRSHCYVALQCCECGTQPKDKNHSTNRQ
jgi:hypothetical protein